MNKTMVLAKHAKLMVGQVVVMSNAELDWLIDRDLHASDVVSIPNPQQVGTLDAFLVGKLTCPQMMAERAKVDLLTSATRSAGASGAWDEPKGASTPRGWYWPKGSTCAGKTLCAGHYLDYGAGHYRYDGQEESEPGHIHCVVIGINGGKPTNCCYVETVDAARTWIELEAARIGHQKA